MIAVHNMQRVLSELGVKFSVPELKFDKDQSCFVACDQQAVNIQLMAEKVYLTTHVATLPSKVPAKLYETLLQANLYGKGTNGAILSLEPESRGVLLQDVLEGETCTLKKLIARLENLLAVSRFLAEQIESRQSDLH
jgi:hypothetical protein